MKHRLQIAGSLYVIFAIFAAYTSSTSAQPHLLQKLDYTHSVSVDKSLKNYTVTAWTTSWCSGCQKWKQEEYPKLKKAGIKVKLADIDKVPRPSDVKVVPTIQVLYKGKVICTKVYWKADDILKFLKGRTSLKKG